jgi:signal transduction histidine kinase
MGNDHRRPMQREGVLFFGDVIAGLSHELSNVFNIINEIAGLQQDIVRGAQPRGAAAEDRLTELAGRIKAQVERGETFNQLLHSLAHSVDDANIAFDLGDTLELAGSLAARRARLARVELVVHRPKSPVTLVGDPFALLLTIFGSIGAAVGAADSKRRVEVSAAPHDNGAQVFITSADPLPPGVADTVAALEIGRLSWGAVHTLDPPSPEPPRRIILDVPAVAPALDAPADDEGQEDPDGN